MKRKVLLIVFILLVLLFFVPQEAQAYVSNVKLVNELDTDDYQGGSFTFYSVTKTIESLNALMIGTGDEEVDKKIGASALESASSLIATLYTNPPASSTYYLADLGQRLNIVQPAYAQGIGFSGLRPLLPLWRASRNIAYIFFILIFIITGFAIMFRAKIDPQTVVTVQAAIPKVIIALILVTFSYAIAGLMIDLMYLTIGLSLAALTKFANVSLPRNIPNYYGLGFGDLFNDVWDAGWESIKNIKGPFSPLLNKGIEGTAAIGTIIGAIIGGGFTAAAIGPAAIGLVAGSVGMAVLLLFVIAIIILYTVFRIFFTLLKSYVGIVISILVAPLQLMLSAIPGQNTFGSWIRSLLSNILVFPAVIIMLTLANILSGVTGNLWTPPLLGSFGKATGQAAGAILGFGIILMTPKVADIIKSMFEKKPFPYGAAIGEAMGPAKGIGGLTWQVGGRAGAEKITEGWEAKGPVKRGIKTFLQGNKIVQ